jgi:hypothetical protein
MGLAYLIVRIAFFPFSIVPAAVPLDPLWVLLAARGGLRKPHVALALLPGLIAVDLLAGMGGWVVAARVVGLAAVLWTSPEGGFHTRYLHALCLHGLWSSLVPDWQGVYPLSYLYLVWGAQGLLWWGLAAPKRGGGHLARAGIWLPVPLAVLAAHVLLSGPSLWPLPRPGFSSGWPLTLAATLVVLVHPGVKTIRWWRNRNTGTPSVEVWS